MMRFDDVGSAVESMLVRYVVQLVLKSWDAPTTFGQLGLLQVLIRRYMWFTPR